MRASSLLSIATKKLWIGACSLQPRHLRSVKDCPPLSTFNNYAQE